MIVAWNLSLVRLGWVGPGWGVYSREILNYGKLPPASRNRFRHASGLG